MPAGTANGDSRLQMWRRVREFAVPQSMIVTATARRAVGDWAGACAAARVEVDLDLRAVARHHGRGLVSALRADLRHLAPDLLRWHLPRIAPDGLLRPGLTMTLARYARDDGGAPLHLVARTPPAWADVGQRVGLAVWDPERPGADVGQHPHPHPPPRFRLDLHRHLWDARASASLRERAGAPSEPEPELWPEPYNRLTPHRDWAVDRWAAEAALLLRADGRASRRVAVRLARGQRLVLDLDEDGGVASAAYAAADRNAALPLLPAAATFVLPDLELLRAGLIEAEALHPLVAAALLPGPERPVAAPAALSPPWSGGAVRIDGAAASAVLLVECAGARHRLGLVDGRLTPLDHDPAELRREELLAALTGTPMPCLRAVDQALRSPAQLEEVRGRLDHGDDAGARAIIDALVGPEATLRDGPLRDELHSVLLRRIEYGLYRTGQLAAGPPPDRRTHPRHRTRR